MMSLNGETKGGLNASLFLWLQHGSELIFFKYLSDKTGQYIAYWSFQ